MSMPARSRRSPVRREQLIAAAIAVITEHGLEAATTRRVAAHAGVSLGSVHYIFANKSEMIAAVIDYVADAINAALLPGVRHLSQQKSDPHAVQGEIVRYFWEFVEADPNFQLVQYELTIYCLRHSEERWLAVRQYDRYRAIVTDVLAATNGHPSGPPQAAFDDLARQIVAGLDGIILQFLIHRDVEQARHDVSVLSRSISAVAQ